MVLHWKIHVVHLNFRNNIYDLGIIIVSNDALAIDNAKAFIKIIENRLVDHPITELICLNSAVIIHIADNTQSIQESYHRAKDVFKYGKLDYLLFD